MTDEKNLDEQIPAKEPAEAPAAAPATPSEPPPAPQAPPASYAQPAPPPMPPPAPDTSRSPLSYKNPTLAAAFSVVPGLGHIYNGLYVRGLTFIVTFVALIGFASHGAEIMVLGVIFFWLFNLFDAYRQATLINYGYATDLGVTDRPRSSKPGASSLALGALLFVLGLYGMLERYFRIDLDWLIDLWPFGLMALGGWIIWSALKQRKQATERETELSEDYL